MAHFFITGQLCPVRVVHSCQTPLSRPAATLPHACAPQRFSAQARGERDLKVVCDVDGSSRCLLYELRDFFAKPEH
jgi:hypothetical protein